MAFLFQLHSGARWALFVWAMELGVEALQLCGEEDYQPNDLFDEVTPK